MNTQTQRYVFLDFENLQQVKFKKLEKVASKIIIFVETEQENVPLLLTQQMQRFGKNVRWIVMDNPSGNHLNYQIAFIMGKLHQKADPHIEFAVVSDDDDFDPLVNFINQAGRRCLRIHSKKEEEILVNSANSMGHSKQHHDIEPDHEMSFGYNGNDTRLETVAVEEEIIGRTAEETVKRLIRSGNRPQEVVTLKNYILLHNQELSLHGHIDRIVQKMRDKKDIEIRKGEVIYNF